MASETTGVTHQTLYADGPGFGWADGVVRSTDREQPDDLRRDMNYSDDATFRADVPNGEYRLRAIIGDREFAHSDLTFFIEGVFAGSYNTNAAQYREIEFVTHVFDGVVDVQMISVDDLVPLLSLEVISIALDEPP